MARKITYNLECISKYTLFCEERKEKFDAVDAQAKSPLDAVGILRGLRLHMMTRETACGLFVNAANKVIGYSEIGSGVVNMAMIDLQTLFSTALLIGRVRGIILAHNHPSGNVAPSNEDIRMTKGAKEVAGILNITLLDHIIISETEYYSFASHELI